jgi:hypothetical protein
MSLGRLGGAFALLYAAHTIGDHWVQRDSEACTKGQPDNAGRRACATHVASLTATQAVFLTAGALASRERLDPRHVALALAVNAASHYWADRRHPLKKLAEKTGKSAFVNLGDPKAAPCGTGAYALDQSWHIGWLAVAAAIATT